MKNPGQLSCRMSHILDFCDCFLRQGVIFNSSRLIHPWVQSEYLTVLTKYCYIVDVRIECNNAWKVQYLAHNQWYYCHITISSFPITTAILSTAGSKLQLYTNFPDPFLTLLGYLMLALLCSFCPGELN